MLAYFQSSNVLNNYLDILGPAQKLVLGDSDDTTMYRDTKSIAILLSIHMWQNFLNVIFVILLHSSRHFDYTEIIPALS